MTQVVLLVKRYGDARAAKALHNGLEQQVSCDAALSAVEDALLAFGNHVAALCGGPAEERETAARLIAAAIKWRAGESCRCGPGGLPTDHTDDCPADKLDGDLFGAVVEYEAAIRSRGAEPGAPQEEAKP